MTYNVVDGYDAELVEELVKARQSFLEKIDRISNYQDVAIMMLAYATARKEARK